MAQRSKSSVRAVENTRRNSLWVIFWIILIHVAAITQFTRGFLLTRPVLQQRSDEPSLKNAPFDRAVILVVDALRYDFVEEPGNQEKLPYLGHFPVEELSNDPRHSFIAKFLADPPTTTLQRLKGLTTGSLPAFIDAGANFAGFKIEEDNWVSQAAERLGPVAFVGDDTWEALFSHAFSENYPFPSLNVRDLDTVDNGVKQILPSLIKNTTNRIMIGHMLGVDHVGHRYGPAHPAMSKKLDETFDFVREVASMIDDKTVLIVMGDHGMDQTGNHGGDSQDELEAALWIYSKRAAFNGQKAKRDSGKNTVQQIDLVPTISGLLGLPIPFNSLGFPVRQVFSTQHWEQVSRQAKKQLLSYTEAVGLPSASHAAATSIDAPPAEFQKIMLETFRDAWVQFDMKAMYLGMGLLAASILQTLLLYNSVAGKSLTNVAQFQTMGALIGIVTGLYGSHGKYDQTKLEFASMVLFHIATGVLIMGSLPALRSPNLSLPSWWSIYALIVLGIEVATSFSNSFVIWESRILHFLLATLFVLLALKCARGRSPIVMYLAGWYIVSLLVVQRLSSSWVVCREETASSCSTTFFEAGTSLVPTWTLFAVGILGLVFPYFLKRFWSIGKNDVGTAQLLLNMTSLAMTIVLGYWSLDNAEARGWISHDAFGLQTGKLVLGRIALLFGAVGGIIIWWRSNVPIEIVLRNNRADKIEGYNNAHGAYALLTVICLFWSFSISHKPPAILSLAGLVYTCLGTLDFIDISGTKYTIIVPVLFDMLANGYFYYTGHQATIPSIQWDTAFVAARTVSFPWSPLTVMLNTLSPFFLSGIACVLSATWRRPPFKDPNQPMIFTLRAALGLSTVCAIRALASMGAAFLLRRHLMSWKIFAPRFMFGAVSLIATDIACIIGATFGGHSIKKITEMFGYP